MGMNSPVEVPPVIPHALEVQFARAIDLYIADMRSYGRINSDGSERSYRRVLDLHRRDVQNRDPRTTGREDCKATLARWPNPNTQRGSRSILVSFYDWTVEEGMRATNPARQTHRPRARPTTVYRLTRDEASKLLAAALGSQERRAIHLGLCAGLRSAELRGLQGRHFEREGYIWISADIGKGKRERFEPVLAELVPVVADIRATVEPDHYVLTAMRYRDPPFNSRQVPVPTLPMSNSTLWNVVGRVARRAGITAHIHPHLLRHAFADHIARHAGLRVAQAMMGHANVSTTQGYTGIASLDEIADAVRGLSYDAGAITPEVAALAQ